MKTPNPRSSQRGFTMIVVLLMLSAVFIVAAFSSRLSILGEKATRNDRDHQSALLGAEAALKDAEADLLLGSSAPNARCGYIRGGGLELTQMPPNVRLFEPDCGNVSSSTDGSISTRGLCAYNAGNTPLYKSIDWEASGNNRRYVNLGEFTGNTDWANGDSGLPKKAPKYIIELLPVKVMSSAPAGSTAGYVITTYGFLVSALGYGLTPDSMAMVQGLFIKVNPQDTCPAAS